MFVIPTPERQRHEGLCKFMVCLVHIVGIQTSQGYIARTLVSKRVRNKDIAPN